MGADAISEIKKAAISSETCISPSCRLPIRRITAINAKYVIKVFNKMWNIVSPLSEFSTNVEKYTKKAKKGIDKRGSMCYNDQAFERGQAQSQSESRDEKSFLKTFQKGIDKVKTMCYNNQARCESGERDGP